eukprot:1604707-Prymnesium_polylepis.1
MREVQNDFGLPVITFDESEERPVESRRRMSQWLRGAGGVESSRGVEFQLAGEAAIGQVEQCVEESSGR